MLIIEVILTIIAGFRGFKWWALMPILIAIPLGFALGFNLAGSEYLWSITLVLDVVVIITLLLMVAFKKEKFCDTFGIEYKKETKEESKKE
jgi:hypothetical protein